MSPPTWRLLISPPAGGAENMALDDALMDRARETGEWVLRVYEWAARTISLGRNQTARGRYDLDGIRARGMTVVRRPTGGRAILHDHEITYSVTAPAADAGELRASYERINEILVAALDRLGVAATVAAPATRAMTPGTAPCFDAPAAGELTVAGRKLAGSAQWRCDGALLQHGSILVEDDQRLLADLLLDTRPPSPRPATLAEALGRRPAARELASALAAALRDVEGQAPEPLDVEAPIRARTAALVVRYLDDSWTWRR